MIPPRMALCVLFIGYNTAIGIVNFAFVCSILLCKLKTVALVEVCLVFRHVLSVAFS